MSAERRRVTGAELGLDYRKPRGELLVELIDQLDGEPGGFVWMHQEDCRTRIGPCSCVPDLVTTQTTMLQ